MEEEDPQSQALRNPIILQKIFQYQHLERKTFRLVCHVWNEVTLSLRPPKIDLHLDTDDCCYDFTEVQSFCSKMEPRLARSVYARSCLCGYPNPISFKESPLLHVSSQFGQFIENLTVIFDHAKLIPTFYEILRNGCPNLRSLQINFESMEGVESTDEDPRPCTLQKLTDLIILDDPSSPDNLNMTQWVLNGAPNLTRFYLDNYGNRFPDLGRNKSIKKLELSMQHMLVSTIQSANYIRSVNKMLDQVKDSVEFLYLLGDESFENDIPRGPVDLQFPKMKKLKEFNNCMLNWLGCGDKLQSICTARIPTLQSLLLSTSRYNPDRLSDLLRNITVEKDLFSGVKNLKVSDLRAPELIAGLKTPFPNLERLLIPLGDYNYSPLIKPYLKSCGSLGLKYLKIRMIRFEGQHFSHFIRTFSNCGELWSGLKVLKICYGNSSTRFSDNPDLVEDGIAQVKQCLLGMKRLEDVQILGMILNRETWKWMEPFIDENKIPIIFA